MIKIECRAPDELDIAATLKGSESLLRKVIFASIVFGVLAALIYAVSRSLIAAAVVSGGLFISSLISNLRFFNDIDRRKRMMSDVKAVEVINVVASRIIEIEPIGTGVAYVFFAAPGEAILVNGQWQLEFKPFPVSQFKIHRWADTKKPIRIESEGSLIFPEKSDVIVRANYVLGDVELFKANPDTLQQDMEAAFGDKGRVR